MMKRFFGFIILLAIIVGGAYYLGRDTADPNREIEWGVSFSLPFVQKMGLDWKQAYLAILDDLQIKNIRLIAYWTEIEPKDDLWDFRDLDWQIEEAAKRDVKIILALGRKLPRWPECHEPEWVKNKESTITDQRLQKYIEQVVNRYKGNAAIFAWQVENEPFLKFGECPKIDAGFLDEEIALVRQLDSRPIIITDSGELSVWYEAARRGDIFGTTMYRYVWQKWIGKYKYPIPSAFFRVKERIIRFFVGQKPFIVVELQGEPWQQKQIYEISINEQVQNLSLDEFKGIIGYAKEAGFSEYYLWGAEWWYYLKQNNHPEYWEYVKSLRNTD